MIFVRDLTEKEEHELYLIMEEEKIGYRAKIILLSNEGYTVPEIREMMNRHDGNIRKWIHRFNEEGISGITHVRRAVNNIRITEEQKAKIVEMAQTEPRKLGMRFSNWSLRKLVWYVTKKAKIVDEISHEKIRQILIGAGIKWRRTRNTLKSLDPEYDFKKSAFWNCTRRSQEEA